MDQPKEPDEPTEAPTPIQEAKGKRRRRLTVAVAAASVPTVPESMQTQLMPIGQVRRYWRNPRRKQNIDKIAASLRKYGWRQPIVVDAENVIIVGDTRYLGAQANSMTHVPVWIARDLDEAQVHGYRLADNRIAEESEWDEDSVTAELELLQSLGLSDMADLEEATGFDEEELSGYLGLAGDDSHGLEPLDVKQFPPYTWVLIGIATARYHEIAEQIEQISAMDDLFCEVTANDDRP
jgi:ParB-like chromosome segregation protein Spo0J